MSDTIGILLTANNAGFIAAMQQAGTITDREAKRMQTSLTFLQKVAKDFQTTQKAANDASVGLKDASGVIEKLGFNTTVARRELVVLAHEMSQGNYTKFGGSLMVLAEHSNLLAVAFSSAGIAAIGTTAGLAAFGVAAMIGAKESDELRKSLILTGNFAGQTSSSFDALASSTAASSGASIGHTKDGR
jgi:phage-related minor tail protein